MSDWTQKPTWQALRRKGELEVGLGELPDQITEQWLRKTCEEQERFLRLQFTGTGGQLPPGDEMELQRRPPTSRESLWQRRMYLAHLYIKLDQDLKAASDQVEVEDAAKKLLRRDPVEVDLGFQKVGVTARSYSAMEAMARHWIRILDLETDIERCERLEQELAESVPDDAEDRTRFRKVTRIHARTLTERGLHRRAIYAHLFTEDGAPADSLEDAPDWFDQVDPGMDGLLMIAAYRAGPGRLSELGEPPDPDSDREKEENWGWHSLFGTIEREQDLAPATLYDRDLFQLSAWLRGSAPPPPKELT